MTGLGLGRVRYRTLRSAFPAKAGTHGARKLGAAADLRTLAPNYGKWPREVEGWVAAFAGQGDRNDAEPRSSGLPALSRGRGQRNRIVRVPSGRTVGLAVEPVGSYPRQGVGQRKRNAGQSRKISRERPRQAPRHGRLVGKDMDAFLRPLGPRRPSRRRPGRRPAARRQRADPARGPQRRAVPADAAQSGKSRRDLRLCRCLGAARRLRGGGFSIGEDAAIQPQFAAGSARARGAIFSDGVLRPRPRLFRQGRWPPIRRPMSWPARLQDYLAQIAKSQSRHQLSGYIFLGGQYQTDANVAPGSPLILVADRPGPAQQPVCQAAIGQRVRQRVAVVQLRSGNAAPRHPRSHQRRLPRSLPQPKRECVSICRCSK